MRVVGGFKTYESADATKRWFFNLALEMPTERFVTGEIIYQYITFEDEDQDDDYTGAVACKIEVGDTSKTQVDQWVGVTDLSSESDEIVGRKWYKQNKDTKMTEPKYEALFYKDLFELVESPRTGYSVQMCEVEIKVDDDVNFDNMVLDMTVGARIYENNDATEFYSTPEKWFDWYQSELEFSEELKVVPVYELETAKPKVNEEKKFEVDLTSTISQDRIDNYNSDIAAREAAIAEAEAAANTDTDSSSGKAIVSR